ncbi:Protein M3 [Mycoemilia scoparia]|uniref:Protein M3 n=1 Tax=Mycoemilia scoparia TaxID=417184 RepID=A0A9W8A0F2_9FUNG|nr:Protein M3 [Mycoemilia scoparia]
MVTTDAAASTSGTGKLHYNVATLIWISVQPILKFLTLVSVCMLSNWSDLQIPIWSSVVKHDPFSSDLRDLGIAYVGMFSITQNLFVYTFQGWRLVAGDYANVSDDESEKNNNKAQNPTGKAVEDDDDSDNSDIDEKQAHHKMSNDGLFDRNNANNNKSHMAIGSSGHSSRRSSLTTGYDEERGHMRSHSSDFISEAGHTNNNRNLATVAGTSTAAKGAHNSNISHGSSSSSSNASGAQTYVVNTPRDLSLSTTPLNSTSFSSNFERHKSNNDSPISPIPGSTPFSDATTPIENGDSSLFNQWNNNNTSGQPKALPKAAFRLGLQHKTSAPLGSPSLEKTDSSDISLIKFNSNTSYYISSQNTDSTTRLMPNNDNKRNQSHGLQLQEPGHRKSASSTSSSLSGGQRSKKSLKSPKRFLSNIKSKYFKSTPRTRKICKILRLVFTPVTISCIIGLTIGMTPPLKKLFYDPDSTYGPPFGFIINAFYAVGQSLPIFGLLNLGSALASNPFFSSIKKNWLTAAPLTFANLVIRPLCCLPLVHYLLTLKLGFISPQDLSMQFISCMAAGVPSASLVVVLTQLYNPSGEAGGVAVMLALQYIFVPITLTLVIFMAIFFVS